MAARRKCLDLLAVLFLGHVQAKDEPNLGVWLKPHDWKRDSDKPALSLGEKGKFDDQHIFAPHVILVDGEYWMYYSGSQRCVDAGTYKGVAKDPKQPEKSDQRLFKLGLAKSKDGIRCDACPVLCLVKPDDFGACDRYTNIDGKLTVRYPDHDEVYEAGDAFYMPPGHVPVGQEPGTEFVMFSPADELEATNAAVVAGMAHAEHS